VLSRTESPLYWEFLKELAVIKEFYNFNGFEPVNFNPYNFSDNHHFYKEVGDKMTKIIFGEEEPLGDWGLLLNSKNIDSYLERRKAKYFELKKEWEETGVVPLGKLSDSSCLVQY